MIDIMRISEVNPSMFEIENEIRCHSEVDVKSDKGALTVESVERASDHE